MTMASHGEGMRFRFGKEGTNVTFQRENTIAARATLPQLKMPPRLTS